MSVIQTVAVTISILVAPALRSGGAPTTRHHNNSINQPFAASSQHKLNEQLLAAVNAGRSAQVSALLAQGADPNTRYYDGSRFPSSSLLMEAAALGELAIVQALLKYGAKVNARGFSCMTARYEGDFRNSTALIEACLRDGNEDVIDTLLAQGADVNARDKSGGTALSATVWRSNWAEAAVLLHHGARTDRATRKHIAERLKDLALAEQQQADTARR